MAETWTPITWTNDTGQKVNATNLNRIENGMEQFDDRIAAVETAPPAHGHDAADLTSGLIAPARLGTGAANSSTVLYGDRVYRVPGGGSSGYATVQDEGTSRTPRTTLNFTGTGVTVTDDSANSRTQVTIAGASGSGYLFSADNTGTVAIQDTLVTQANAAAAAGQPLIIPPGDYLITDAPFDMPVGLTMWAPTRGARFIGNRIGNIMWVRSGMTLRGLTFRNEGTGDPAQVLCINADAHDVLIEDCSIEGAPAGTNSNGQGIIINQSGIKRLTIRGCRLDTLGYAILTNVGANDLEGLIVEDCTFDNVYGDGVELNHPSGSAPAVRGIRIANNKMRLPDFVDANSNSGFAIGAAGVRDLTIIGNTILVCRREAVHIEDDCHAVTIVGNTIKDILGGGTSNGVAIYPSCSDITVADNTIENVIGGGICTIYDPSTNLVRNLTVTGNIVRDITGSGIIVGADHDEGGRFIVSDNIVFNVSENGISVLGDMDEAVVHDNLVHTCGEYGIYTDGGGTAGKIRSYRDNVIVNCTLGDYRANPGGTAIVLPDRMALVPVSAVTVGTTVTVPLMRLGDHADGLVCFQARRIGQANTRMDATWRVRWNGATLVAHSLANRTTGVIGATLSMVNGTLSATVDLGAAGVSVECSATFEGIALENGGTFTGTVSPTSMAVTGSRGGNAALASLLTALANGGFITNSTSA